MRGGQSRPPPPTYKITRHSWTTVGKFLGGPEATAWRDGTGALQCISWCHRSVPYQKMVCCSQKPVKSSSFVFPIRGIPEKWHLHVYKIMFNSCFLSFFGLFGFVHVRSGGGRGVWVTMWMYFSEWANVRVCLYYMCVFKGLWELVRFRSDWEAVLISGWWWVSLYWQTGENRPPRWVLAKLALFILNIYNMCACTVLCN